MIIIAKYIVILFGVFIFGVGLLMLFNPEKARDYLRKAGSTPLINYAEITIRMIPAAGLILYSDYSKYPQLLMYFGWFMIATSFILYFVPRKLHHGYALRCATILTPNIVRLISPLSMLLGTGIIYSVL